VCSMPFTEDSDNAAKEFFLQVQQLQHTSGSLGLPNCWSPVHNSQLSCGHQCVGRSDTIAGNTHRTSSRHSHNRRKREPSCMFHPTLLLRYEYPARAGSTSLNSGKAEHSLTIHCDIVQRLPLRAAAGNGYMHEPYSIELVPLVPVPHEGLVPPLATTQ
jgi:hypothetical protein